MASLDDVAQPLAAILRSAGLGKRGCLVQMSNTPAACLPGWRPRSASGCGTLLTHAHLLRRPPARRAAPPPWLRDGFCAHVVKPAPGGQGVVRQYDAAVVDEMLASYVEQDYTALVAAPPPGCALHLAWGTAGAQWVKDGAEEVGGGGGGNRRGAKPQLAG